MCCGLDTYIDPVMEQMSNNARGYMTENDLEKVVIARDNNGKLVYCETDDERLGASLKYQKEVWL